MMAENDSRTAFPLVPAGSRAYQIEKIMALLSRLNAMRAKVEAYRRAMYVDQSHRYLIDTRLGIMRPRRTTEGWREEIGAAFRANPYKANVLANIAAQRRALASSKIGEYFSAEDSAQETARQNAIDDAIGQRIAREERVNALRDRLRQFRWGTKLSGFGRYVKAEAESNAAVDERRAESERAKVDESDFNRRLNLRASLNRRSEMLQFAKEFPAFFRNTKMSTKDIRDMSKTLKGMSRIPLIGGMLRMNPTAIAATVTLGVAKAVDSIWKDTQRSNLAVENFRAQIGFGGLPSPSTLMAGAKIGMTKESVAQAYAKTNLRYGGQAETIYRSYAEAARGKNPFQKMALAQAFHLSDQEAMLALALDNKDMTQGQANLAAKEALGAGSEYARSSNAPWWLKAIGYAYEYTPFVKSTWEMATGYWLKKASDSTQDAALSGVDFDRRYGGAQTVAPTQFYPGESGKRISFYIQNMDVNANDAAGFAESLGKEAGKRGGREVIEAFDTKEL